MEPTEVLRKALAAVKEAEVPDDLRELAFSKAVDLYAGTIEASPNSGGGGQHEEKPPPPPSDPEEEADEHVGLSQGLREVAEFYDLPRDELGDYFAEDEEGELQFTNDPDDLSTKTQQAVRELSLLVGAARKAGGYDSTSTSVEAFRKECQRHGIYDGTNFSKHVGGMTKWFTINGAGKSRTFALKPTGRKEAKKLMSKLAGRE